LPWHARPDVWLDGLWQENGRRVPGSLTAARKPPLTQAGRFPLHRVACYILEHRCDKGVEKPYQVRIRERRRVQILKQIERLPG